MSGPETCNECGKMMYYHDQMVVMNGGAVLYFCSGKCKVEYLGRHDLWGHVVSPDHNPCPYCGQNTVVWDEEDNTGYCMVCTSTAPDNREREPGQEYDRNRKAEEEEEAIRRAK